MAKRFIDTEFFKLPFVRSLKPDYKLFYIFMMTNCDHAGCWVPDFEIASIYTGLTLDEKEVFKVFESKIIKCKDRWFFPEFVQFQYGPLNPKNNAHLSVIKILKEQGIDPEGSPLPSPSMSPSQGCKAGAMDKDKDKDLFKDKDQDKDLGKDNELPTETEKNPSKSYIPTEPLKSNIEDLKQERKNSENIFGYENPELEWVLSNYPIGKGCSYTEKDRGEIKILLDVLKDKIGFDKIHQMVLDERNKPAETVLPLDRFLTKQIQESENKCLTK